MKAWLATFPSDKTLVAAAQQVRQEGFALLDALTPMPVPGLEGVLETAPARLRGPMAVAGFGTAIAATVFEWWSAAVAYPFNAGGRPLFSWQVAYLVPFEVGILAAAVVGFVAFLIGCGLPRLNHPAFDVPGLPRASQDRFMLLVDPAGQDETHLQRLLFGAGALAVSETEP